MKVWKLSSTLVCLLILIFGYQTVDAQENLAQQAYAIFEQSCLNCHGPNGAFTEEIIIEHTALIETGAVVPGKPIASELYRRLLDKDPAKRMPQGQPQLPAAAILTIGNWIQAGAPDWQMPERDTGFITPTEMLETIENHLNSLPSFDRPFTRYFTMTHLYNAGEPPETLRDYQRALSKLVNSLSWGRKVIRPQPIDAAETIFYIDLRDYEWELGTDRWELIEAAYPYRIAFEAPSQTSLREKLTNLRAAMKCEVPSVDVDWFIATASLPPLYHDILGLPETDRELETRLEVNVVENIRNAAGKRVWRAGFNNSGVSNHNRVVERHTSQHGAYWKSYDFSGSVGTQNIFTHPLSFTHDGGEIIFNLPNGLQAYYLSDAGGRRLDEAPINIVSNPAASDPTVRNGLSCIGCHTEGMKDFEDRVRGVVEKNPDPPFNKARALRLYTDAATMNALIDEDTARYSQALEATGGVLGGIEPVQRFHEAFQRPLDAGHAAAAVGLESEVFLERIRENVGLQQLGLLVLETGTIKRDTWTSKFSEVVFALEFPTRSGNTEDDRREEIIPGASVHIPDPNLRAAIADALGKHPSATITPEEMATLTHLAANNRGIQDLTGLEFAINLDDLFAPDNQIADLSPLSELTNLRGLSLWLNPIESLSPIAGLSNLEYITLVGDGGISDLSPLAGLLKLKHFLSWGNPLSDLTPLAGSMQLEILDICGADVSDVKPLAKLTGLKVLYLVENDILDVSPLSELTNLTRLSLEKNNISDVSSLATLTNLKWLGLHHNSISDFSPLAALPDTTIFSRAFNPGVPTGGPKIEGPWLWITVPGEGLDRQTDLLAEASSGNITEQQVATHGAIEGSSVGNDQWTQGKIAPSGQWNIADMLDEIGSETNSDNHIVYGSIILDSPREQDTHLFFGGGGRVKIWLNGELVYQSLVWPSRNAQASDYHDFLPVTLKKGRNVLLAAIDSGSRENWWNGFFGLETGTEYSVSNPQIGYTLSVPKIHAGDTFTLALNVADVHDLAGWQFDIAFDPTVLEVLEVSEGDFLKTDNGTTFFQKGSINNTTGKITKLSSARLSEDGVNGTGTLLSVAFTAKTPGQAHLKLENFQLAAITGAAIPVGLPEIFITVEGQLTTGDVNRDGQVSILDMVLVARQFGNTVPLDSAVDINGDGVINVLDLILVSQKMGASTAAAPPMLATAGIHELNPAFIQSWIALAQLEDDGSLVFREGIAKLQELLSSLLPKEMALLANYPNPFNPETWIPYQLSEPAEVTLRIYSVNGVLVRTLVLGHLPAGTYQSQSRAAYWDGRNDVGESVASGVYFYTLTAGDFTATRKMLIRK